MFIIIVLGSYTLANCAFVKTKLLVKENNELNEYNNFIMYY